MKPVSQASFLTSREIRQRFLDFFARKGHKIVPSAPLIPHNDPTLLFTNAGMNQFKDVFLGQSVPPASRVANTQKCLRVSGKHNDLEEVGHDGYHHTFFEMLGNWSFGDYFKREAIEWALELLTESYHLSVEDLYATVYPGSETVPEDTESWNIWSRLLPEGHVLKGTHQDNFWEMGDEGPCGPSTEIHIDLRSPEEKRQTPATALINQNHPQVIELWNIVFIQFNRRKDGRLEPLARHFVDTGMGLERLCMVLQGKTETYETDLLHPIILRAEEETGATREDPQARVALRVIADHLRAVAFAIADGILPGNTGRGYVLRRLIRRAVRYYYQHLEFSEPLLQRLAPILLEIYGDVFPELKEQMSLIQLTLKEEERSFLRVIRVGLQRFHDMLEHLRQTQADQRMIPGEMAFYLHDTFGFPLDLTRLLAREQGYEVDEAGFQAEMKKQRERARQAQELNVSDWVPVHSGTQQFVGYDQWSTVTRILQYRKVRHIRSGKEWYEIVLETVPFYPEGGGQVGDTGVLQPLSGSPVSPVRVEDTYRIHEWIVVKTSALPPDPAGELRAEVDSIRRWEIMKHHSATHLLHAALRKILGNHVRQRGSFLNDQYLRFDFSHPSAVRPDELEAIERLVNEKIQENIPLQEERDVPLSEALQRGVLAFFGEKYGERVRIVTFDPNFSSELCGGTHVPATGHIGMLKILSERSVSAGVRRIEAVAGKSAWKTFYHLYRQWEGLRQELHQNDPIRAIQQMQEEIRNLRREREQLVRRIAGRYVEEALARASDHPLLLFVGMDDVPPEAGREVIFSLRKKTSVPLVAVYVMTGDEKKRNQILLAVSEGAPKEFREKLGANRVLAHLQERISGLKGGGSPRFASGVIEGNSIGPAVLEQVLREVVAKLAGS